MKKLIYIILLSFWCMIAQAGNIRAILVEYESANGPVSESYHLTIYGRLDGGTAEHLDVKDPSEIAKLTGIESQSEFDLKGVKPIRYWIWFADASNPDKVEGSISQIDIHTSESNEFVQKIITPEAVDSKLAVADLKALVETKPVDDGK